MTQFPLYVFRRPMKHEISLFGMFKVHKIANTLRMEFDEFLTAISNSENIDSSTSTPDSVSNNLHVELDEDETFGMSQFLDDAASDVLNFCEIFLKWIEKSDNQWFVFGTALIGASIPIAIYYFRHCMLINITCWACNKENQVVVKNKNRFACQHCDQFNGFTDDGNVDFNAEAEVRGLSPDFVQDERNSVYCERQSLNSEPTAPTLCPQCQDKADYKVKALRTFEPTREDRYEIELELFERRVEIYSQPCRNCQNRINRYLAQLSAQMPKYVPQRSMPKYNATSINSIISQRRQHITKSAASSTNISRLTISRLKLIIYVNLILTALTNIFGASFKNYFELLSVSTICAYFGIVYNTSPSLKIISLSLFILKDFWSTIETNFSVPQYIQIIGDSLSKLNDLNIKFSYLNLNVKTVIIYLLWKAIQSEFVNQLKTYARLDNNSSNVSKPLIQPLKSPKKTYGSQVNNFMDFTEKLDVSRLHLKDGFTPPPSFVGVKSYPGSIFRQSKLSERTAEPMEDDITPFDSVSNWGDDYMEQSFEAEKTHNVSMNSDALSILSDAVQHSVTAASVILRYILYAAAVLNVIFMCFLVNKIIKYAPAKGRITM